VHRTDRWSYYAPFSPPRELNFREWSPKEAREYFGWFTAQLDARIDQLRRVAVGCNLDMSPTSLSCLGRFLVENVRTRPKPATVAAAQRQAIKEPLRSLVPIEPWVLDGRTISLAMDVGIYFGEVLRTAQPSLEWRLWQRATVERNRPVLVGFRAGVPCDPFRLATNICFSAARGDLMPGRLTELFNVWSGKVDSG